MWLAAWFTRGDPVRARLQGKLDRLECESSDLDERRIAAPDLGHGFRVGTFDLCGIPSSQPALNFRPPITRAYLLECCRPGSEELILAKLGYPAAVKPAPQTVVLFNMGKDQKIVLSVVIQFAECPRNIVVGTGVAVVITGLPREGQAEKAVDIVRVLAVIDPFIVEDHQRVNAVTAVLHRQLDSGHQIDVFLSCGFPECLELVPVEFVVVGDNTDPDVRLLQRHYVSRHEIPLGTYIFEFLIPSSV